MIRYDISPLDPEAHLYIVGITIDDPTPDEQYLRLPAWIAGSYLIRDFASTVQAEQAFLGETPVPIEKVDKTFNLLAASARARLRVRSLLRNRLAALPEKDSLFKSFRQAFFKRPRPPAFPRVPASHATP